MNKSNQQNNNDVVRRFIHPMIWTVAGFLLLGFAITIFQCFANRTSSLLLALACLLLGSFVGFLFGIPRVLQNELTNQSDMTESKNGRNYEKTNYTQRVNTNLEQISDWLTKIIVGLGLVNLGKIPSLLQQISKFVGTGISVSVDDKATIIFANALIIYFPILGFLVGYLFTRIFLSNVFQSADTNTLFQIGGMNVPLDTVVKNLVNVASKSLASSDSYTEKSLELNMKVTKPQNILWVDDKPNNNAIERQTLQENNISVITASSTDEAINLLKRQTFDLIISDMGRIENGIYIEKAGINFLIELKELNNDKVNEIPKLIYTTTESAKLYGHEARQLGATEIPLGPFQLMKAIGII